MNIAPPNISVDEWFDFLDGRADARTRRRIQTAVETHDPSRQIFEALQESSARLRQEALRIHRAFDLPERAVAAACARVLDRVRSDQRYAAFESARLGRVEELLTPWCGRRVAAGLLLAAIARTNADSADGLWPAFLEQAETLTSGLCGNAAGRLIAEFGRSLA